MTLLASNNLSALAALENVARSASSSPPDDRYLTSTFPPIREVHSISVTKIDLDPGQPRSFAELAASDRLALLGLAESIRESGLLNPILVRKIQDRFQVVAGERRYRAVRELLKLEHIDALIMDATDAASRLVLQLAENMQRADLADVDVGRSAIRLKSEFKITQQALAKQLGIQPAFISRCIALAEHALAREGLIDNANTLAAVHAMPKDLHDLVIENARRENKKITHTSIRAVLERASTKNVESGLTTAPSLPDSPANETGAHAQNRQVAREVDSTGPGQAVTRRKASGKPSGPPPRRQIENFERFSYLALTRLRDQLLQLDSDPESLEIYVAIPAAIKPLLAPDVT